MDNFKLIVAEPFNFESSDGKNILYCSADVETSAGQFEVSQYLLAECTPFELRGQVVQYLRLSPRHRDDRFLLMEKFLSGREVDVNAAWLKSGEEWTHELAVVPYKEMAPYVGGFIIATAMPRDAVFGRRN